MNDLPPPSTAPAGWYPDPSGVGQRYFDGRAWVATTPGFAEREEHPNLPITAAVGAVVTLVVSLIVGRVVVELLVDLGWPVIVYVIILGLLGYGPSVLWIWYVRRRWGAGRLASIGWKFAWSDLGWGPVAWMAAVATQAVVGAIVLALDIPVSSNVEAISDLEADRAYLIATTITAVIAAPIIEEVVFRGLVMRGLLSRMAPVLAIALQGVLFGLAHADPARGTGNIGLVMVLSGVGVAFGAAAYLTRRLGTSIIAHAIFNGVVLILVLSGVADRLGDDLGALPSVDTEHVVVDQPDITEPSGDEQHHLFLVAAD